MVDKLHVVCPHCHTTNRIVAAASAAELRCGQCAQGLFAAQAFAIANSADFDKHIVRSHIPVLVDFWAPWCGPCLMMAPSFEAAAGQLEPHFQLLKVDTEQLPELAQRYQIRSIPTLGLFHDGRLLARHSGAITTSAAIARWTRDQWPEQHA